MGTQLKGALLLKTLSTHLENLSLRGVKHAHTVSVPSRSVQIVPALMSRDPSHASPQPVKSGELSQSDLNCGTSIYPATVSHACLVKGSAASLSPVDNCLFSNHRKNRCGNQAMFNIPLTNYQAATLDCLTANIAEIGDRVKPGSSKIDTPKIPGLNIEINIPPITKSRKPLENPGNNTAERKSPGLDAPKKEAKLIMKIRHKKMKKHQLRKLRARTWPIMRKVRFLRNRRKMRIFNANLERLRGYGRDFDALEFVKENLEKAKLRGYSYDIFGPHANSYGFTDVKKDTDLGSMLKKFSSKK